MWLRRQVELRGAQVEWKLSTYVDNDIYTLIIVIGMDIRLMYCISLFCLADDAASVVEYSLSLLSFETSSIATAPSTSSGKQLFVYIIIFSNYFNFRQYIIILCKRFCLSI